MKLLTCPNKQPVEGVSVSLHSSSMEVFASASGDQAGMFVLPDLLPASDYRLSVNVAGDYQQYNRQNVTISADSEPLVIALQRLNFGSFEGRVFDSSGVSVGGFELLVKTSSSFFVVLLKRTGFQLR